MLDDTNFCPTRSWHTRMTSVMRQFEKLVSEPVRIGDRRIDVIGIQSFNGQTRLTVSPVDDYREVFATDVEEISL